MTRRGWLLLACCLAGCAPAVPVISLDADACDFCRMVISDGRHAAAAIDAGGRTVRFDSIECLAGWYAAQDRPPREAWVTDAGGGLIPAAEAAFHRDPSGSPMGRDWVAGRLAVAPAGAISWDSLQVVASAEGMPEAGLAPGAVP